ncbi:MAG: arylsulfatase family protein, partial [Reyranella sp.]|nr:arylsulfatase family protein [Reyranella sp.]
RDERFKYIFTAQFSKGMDVWRMPLTPLRAPIMIDLLSDPFENSFDGSAYWEKWVIDRAFLILPAVAKVSNYMASYKEFPPRQRPSSFSIDQVMDKVNAAMKTK